MNVRTAVLTIGLLAAASAAVAQQAPTNEKVYKMSEEITAPRVLQKAEPQYTEEARAAKIEGTVLLSIVIGPDGTAHDINVVNAPDSGLGLKAVEAVQQWKFSPGTKDGQAVAVRAQIEINFKLQ